MRILLVEDDPDVQASVASVLREACFAVDTTASGDEGFKLALHNDYDLLILDYLLPGKDGFEICQALRESEKYVPILILSVKSAIGHKVALLNQGADDYLTKPFSVAELLARVNALLRRPRRVAASVTHLGNMAIDSTKQRVICGKKEIRLTRKEFSLLEYLASHEGICVSRGMLMEHVWDQECDLFSNTIEAHILNLRKKLGAKGKLIETVPGRGYRLN